MPVREIRRESFSHQGRAYDVVVIDDGKRLTAVAWRDGKPVRGSRCCAPPHGWQGYTTAHVDGMIDRMKQWIVDHVRSPRGVGPFF